MDDEHWREIDTAPEMIVMGYLWPEGTSPANDDELIEPGDDDGSGPSAAAGGDVSAVRSGANVDRGVVCGSG